MPISTKICPTCRADIFYDDQCGLVTYCPVCGPSAEERDFPPEIIEQRFQRAKIVVRRQRMESQEDNAA